eukprot:3722666-Prymnesium_polylepis.1
MDTATQLDDADAPRRQAECARELALEAARDGNVVVEGAAREAQLDARGARDGRPPVAQGIEAHRAIQWWTPMASAERWDPKAKGQWWKRRLELGVR